MISFVLLLVLMYTVLFFEMSLCENLFPASSSLTSTAIGGIELFLPSSILQSQNEAKSIQFHVME